MEAKTAPAETKAEKRARKRAERAARRANKEKSTFWKDFKAFISRGNIIDLAIGLVIGAAFTAIVNSVVNDIIKPLISLLIGGNFSEMVVELRPEISETVNGVTTVIQEQILLNYGNLIMAILTFLIDAIVIFTAVRIVRKVSKRIREGGHALKEKLSKKEEAAEPVKEEAPAAEAAPAPAPAPAPVVAEAPAASSENVEKLLAEIRDLLRANSAQEAPAEEKKADK